MHTDDLPLPDDRTEADDLRGADMVSPAPQGPSTGPGAGPLGPSEEPVPEE